MRCVLAWHCWVVTSLSTLSTPVYELPIGHALAEQAIDLFLTEVCFFLTEVCLVCPALKILCIHVCSLHTCKYLLCVYTMDCLFNRGFTRTPASAESLTESHRYYN